MHRIVGYSGFAVSNLQETTMNATMMSLFGLAVMGCADGSEDEDDDITETDASDTTADGARVRMEGLALAARDDLPAIAAGCLASTDAAWSVR